MSIVQTLVRFLLGLSCCHYGYSMNCRQPYDFIIGMLSPKKGETLLQKPFLDYTTTIRYKDVDDCFNTPNYVNLVVSDVLHMPHSGWTEITKGIDEQLRLSVDSKPNATLSVVVGPFYLNLAMILEDLGIPYIVTDYMGIDWSDISRADDDVTWKNLVEVRPPMAEFNGAIVDFFVLQGWESAVIIMPEHPKDNQECQNLGKQMVENNISPISYTLRFEQRSKMQDKTAEVIRNIQKLEQKKIIICSPREEKYKIIEIVLDEARLFRILSEDTYSFFILDPTTHLQALSEINMYRRGLFAVKCNLYAYRYKDLTNETTNFETGYAYGAADASQIINEAKYYYTENVDTQSLDYFSREHFLKALKQVDIGKGETGRIKFNSSGARIDYTLSLYNHGGITLYTKVDIGKGETGRIKFNSSGARIDYTLSLYNHGGITLYTKIATWSTDGDTPDDRLILTEQNKTEGEEARGIFKEVETVVVVIEEPFVMYRPAPAGVTYTGNEQYEGFTIDLLNRISEDLKFKYEIVVAPANEYGMPLDGQTEDLTRAKWGGIVGEIVEKNASIGMGAISITSQRQSVIDFSLGVLSTGVNILIRKPSEKLNIFQFLTPFSLELWMAIIGSSFGVSIIYIILDYRSKERKFTIKSTLWFSIGTLLMKGSDFSPRPVSQRILTTGFLFFVLITVSTYTANMAAFLTKENLEEPVDSFEQLAGRDDLTILTVKNSATMNFFKNSPDNSVYHKIWEKIEKRSGLVANASEGIRRVISGKHAFIFDVLINSYSEQKNCETHSVSAPILLQEHGIAIPHGVSFKSQINIELLRLKEIGFIQELRKKWWEDTRECDQSVKTKSSGQVSFKLKHTAGVFIVGSFGLAAAAFMFLFKKAYVAVMDRIRNSGDLRRDEHSDGSNSSKGHIKSKDPLMYGFNEGKQSTV